jgi:hypothetical protein
MSMILQICPDTLHFISNRALLFVSSGITYPEGSSHFISTSPNAARLSESFNPCDNQRCHPWKNIVYV